jgi:hypothetical protein
MIDISMNHLEFDFNNDHCIYMFTICARGKAHRVVIDDFLPCLDNVPVYCKNRSGAIWQALIQKAMAKFHGGMDQICFNSFHWASAD